MYPGPVHLFLPLLAPLIAAAASFQFDYTDPAGTGFLSLAPPASDAGVLPPGNDGATLGEQRRNVLEAAAAVWAAKLESDVPIVIDASFVNLGGQFNGATLAFASPQALSSDVPGAPFENTAYVEALADAILGTNRLPGAPDFFITVNSAIDDDPLVLGGDGFYYGLDGDPPANLPDLLDTLIHEFAHGLGFVSFVDESDGSYLLGKPVSFTRMIFDEALDAGWTDLTAAQIVSSAVNDPELTFIGPASNAAALRLVKPQGAATAAVRLTVAAPSPAAGDYDAETAEFGRGLPPWGLAGTLVLVDDGVPPTADACEQPFVNADEIRGRVALIDRGTCTFTDKVRRAQDAGAIAVVMVDNVDQPALITMIGNDDTITIPAVAIRRVDGDTIKAALPGTTVTLANLNSRSGTRNGRLRLHGPAPVQPGSSVSHWTTDLFPDQLMEPELPDAIRDNLDLTTMALRDIGWTVTDPDFPFLDYDLWASEEIASAQTASSQNADNDRATNFEEYAAGTDPEDPLSVPAAVTFTAGPDPGTFDLQYPRSRAAADLIHRVERTNGLALPFDPARSGLDFREFGSTPAAGRSETVDLRVESTAPAQFYRITAEQWVP